MSRFLVTGGAGFIGSHIVEQLLARGDEVVILDSLAPDVHATPPPIPDGADLVVGDVADPQRWLDALPGVDAVCHQAARVGLGVDFDDVRRYASDNDMGTAAGLWAMHHTGFGGRIVLASSMVVYGEGRYRCSRDGLVRPGPRQPADLRAGRFEPRCPTCSMPLAWEPVPEDAPADPRNVYAATKLHQEHLCAVFAREHGTTSTALRYHNVYGPRMPRDTPYAGVAAIFRSSVEAGRAPTVLEDGGQRRDFVHVGDVARANVLALTTDAPVDGALNIASGAPHTVLEMATAVCAGSSLVPEVVGGGRLGDVRHIVASPAKASAALGFRAEVDFEAGMAAFATDPLR